MSRNTFTLATIALAAKTAEGGAVLQITGLGPWSITYLDAKDDPRR